MNRRDDFLWSIVTEGAVDRFLGRPRDQNPYTPGQDSTEAWDYGWEEGNYLVDVRGMDERHGRGQALAQRDGLA